MGQLGFSDYSYNNFYPSPRMIKYQVYIKNISCGFEHILFQTEFGNVYVTGSNKYGQLGLINFDKRSKPTKINIFKFKKEKAWKISAGAYHSLIYTDLGYLYGFGKNNYFQLGKFKDIKIEENNDDNKELNEKNNKIPNDINILNVNSIFNTNIIEIKSGKNHSGLLLDNGEVYMWGSNKYNQLGRENKTSNFIKKLKNINNIKKLSFGYDFSMFLNSKGEILVCGNNDKNRLGINSENQLINFPIKLDFPFKIKKISSSNYLSCITEELNLYVWGECPIGFQTKPFLINNLKGEVIDIALGEDYFICLDLDKIVYSYGKNNKGQLGIGNNSTVDEIKKLETLNDQISSLHCGRDFSIGLSGFNPEHLENKTFDNSFRSNNKLLENDDNNNEDNENYLLVIYNKIKENYLNSIEMLIKNNNPKNIDHNMLKNLNLIEEKIIKNLDKIYKTYKEKFLKNKKNNFKKDEILELKYEYEKNIVPSNYKLIYKEYLKGNEYIKDDSNLKEYKKKIEENNWDIDDCINEIDNFFNN